MEEQPKEDPFKQPEVGKITKKHAKHIVNKGGIAVRPAKLTTPTFMMRDQDHPESLPKEGEPKTPNKN